MPGRRGMPPLVGEVDVTHPWGRCNLCGWPIVRVSSSFSGTRCVRCLSTQIHRAAGLVIESQGHARDAAVYELSSKGALFHYLKERFPRLYFSEYFDDVPPGCMKRGIPCQDVQNLKLGDGEFDLVTCTEVFEHVPDDLKGFREIHRVLRRGGLFVFTVPWVGTHDTVERAVLRPGGGIEHLMEPEYHDDRLRGRGKVLAFRTYGRDLARRLQSAGFVAETRIVSSPENRVVGIPVHVARKP